VSVQTWKCRGGCGSTFDSDRMSSYSFFNSLTDDDFVEHEASLIFSNRTVSSSFTSASGVLGGGFEACGIAVVGVLELLGH